MPLDLLRKIEHADLPLTVTDAREIAELEVLRGAGLLEAEIRPPHPAGKSYEPRLAVVLRITGDGRALLASRYGRQGARPI